MQRGVLGNLLGPLFCFLCYTNFNFIGDKVVFGEDLNKTAKLNIPAVLQKTVNFINSHGTLFFRS